MESSLLFKTLSNILPIEIYSVILGSEGRQYKKMKLILKTTVKGSCLYCCGTLSLNLNNLYALCSDLSCK